MHYNKRYNAAITKLQDKKRKKKKKEKTTKEHQSRAMCSKNLAIFFHL